MLFQYVLAEASNELFHHIRKYIAHNKLGNKRYLNIILCKIFHDDTPSLVLVEFAKEVDSFALISILIHFLIFLHISHII